MMAGKYTDKFSGSQAKLDSGLETFNENLQQQNVNQRMQMELIEIAKEKEKVLLEAAKYEAEKTKRLAEIEIKEREEKREQSKQLNAIELDKQKRLAELEIEAKRRELNL